MLLALRQVSSVPKCDSSASTYQVPDDTQGQLHTLKQKKKKVTSILSNRSLCQRSSPETHTGGAQHVLNSFIPVSLKQSLPEK